MVLSSLSWLHFSDLHCGMSEGGILWTNIEAELFKDLKRLHQHCGPWDLMLFTGDLVQSGQEFDKLNKRLQRLYDHLKQLGSDPILLTIPGNHDLVRPPSRQSSVKVLKNWSTDRELQEDFWTFPDNECRTLIDDAFQQYTDWFSHQAIFPQKPNQFTQGSLPGDFAATIEKNGIKLGIVGLNTAFLQLTSGNYQGKLAVHPSQLTAVCGEQVNDWAKQHHLCLLLTHHPPEWLTTKAQGHLNAEIAIPGRFALHLFGHMHESKLCNISMGGAAERRYWQGNSLFGLEQWGDTEKVDRRHGYTAARLDNFDFQKNTCQLHLWPRRAELNQAGNWHIVPDHSFTLKNEETTPEIISLNPIDKKQIVIDFDESPATSSVWEMMPKAFPFEGRTRVIYTCRSSFERGAGGQEQHFKCPTIEPDASNPNLSESKTVQGHIPVDEFETLGLSFVWHGAAILGDNEAWLKEAICCSEVADRDLNVIIKHFLPQAELRETPVESNEEISELLMDNLIVIGENKFSNHLFYLITCQIPWRHTPVRTEICYSYLGNEDSPDFKVKTFFYDCFPNNIISDVFATLREPQYDWGIITFLPNPFAPNKWFLFLVGCSRPGQYLLLSWLRSSQAVPVLSEIAEYQKQPDYRRKFVQVVVRGKALINNPRGTICRQWSMETIKDISNGRNLSFFTNIPTRSLEYSKSGDPIADLSLLARISPEYDWMNSIKNTLPNSLMGLFDDEKNNGDVGFHVTLYEFLHTKGFNDQGFVNSLLHPSDPPNEPFLGELIDCFQYLPPLNIIARQTRITPTSLQVLVDVYASCRELNSVQTSLSCNLIWRKYYPGSIMLFADRCATAMDMVLLFCTHASKNYEDQFNINAVPIPLHLTLLRFPRETTDQQRQDAQEWAKKYQRKVWGSSEDLPIILTRAFRFPFQDVRLVMVT